MKMEREREPLLPKLKTTLSFKRKDPTREDSSEFLNDDDDDDDHKYTSLKDIIVLVHSPTTTQAAAAASAAYGEGVLFDSSNICIKNELVKLAASAYVQSAAAIVVHRDQNCCLDSIWVKITNRVGCCCYWYSHVRKPLRACLRPIFRFLNFLLN